MRKPFGKRVSRLPQNVDWQPNVRACMTEGGHRRLAPTPVRLWRVCVRLQVSGIVQRSQLSSVEQQSSHEPVLDPLVHQQLLKRYVIACA